jgi:L-lactate dehydrogenase complex protein LldG
MVGEASAGETAVSARAEVLAKIRSAVGDNAVSCDAEYGAIARDYKRFSESATEDIVRLLEGRLRDYDAGVFRCGPNEVAQTVAQAMASRGKSSLLRPTDVPDAWLPATHRFPEVHGMSYGEIDKAEGVITGCVAAIAFTGTIILRHSEGDGRRALTLIPDYHLCIVQISQVVETVPEGFARLKGMETMPITTVSGPSATADIEMNRVKGVHGPRFLDIILVS